MLMLLRDFMMHPENNRYKYDYQVNKTSDVTPVDEEMLEPVNAYSVDVHQLEVVLGHFFVKMDFDQIAECAVCFTIWYISVLSVH